MREVRERTLTTRWDIVGVEGIEEGGLQEERILALA